MGHGLSKGKVSREWFYESAGWEDGQERISWEHLLGDVFNGEGVVEGV